MTALEEVKVGRFTISKSSPVRVKSKQGLWRVVSLSERPTGEIFVEVVHSVKGKSRIFPLDQVVYVRPSSRKGQIASIH